MQAGRRIRVIAVALACAVSSFLDATHAVEWVVGGEVQKWSFLHANDTPTFFNDWANDNKRFTTGDTLLFDYDNATHNVQQVTEADFTSCNVDAPGKVWYSGHDVVFIAEAGTFYYICGAPLHCLQGMKVAVTASGAPASLAAPPSAPPPDLSGVITPPVSRPNASLAAAVATPVALFSCASALVLALAVLSW